MTPKSADRMNGRDPLKPVSFFHGVILQARAVVDEDVKTGSAAVIKLVPSKCLNIAMCHYSAGDNIDECVRWLTQAVKYKLLYFEKRNYRLAGYGDLIANLELLSAASLAGKGRELVEAFRGCQVESPEVPRVKGLINQAFAVFKGEPVKQEKAEMNDLKKNGKDLATLAPLFKSVADRSAGAFAKALEDFLSISWAKQIKGIERLPQYCGKWSILSAAACKLMGAVPEISDKAQVYVPTELVSCK